ncbi:MAG TPA: DUF3857 domain-containing protein [Flavisolibacter sp.]|nr:DUF3857 domain-containing protein [Flavisolibacter sp.]
MKKLIPLPFLLFACFISFAQVKYAVSAIPPSLLHGADVVKRIDNERYELLSLRQALYTRKYAFTILNEEGQRFAKCIEYYDKLRKVVGMEGTLYDAAGNAVKKVKGKEINDYSASSDNNLYDDHRVKVHEFNYKVYPYTIEYEVMVEYNHTFTIPSWIPQEEEGIAVEQCSYTFVSPEAYQVRFKSFNYKAEPVVAAEGGKRGLRWEVKNLPVTDKPFAAPKWNELTPTVYFAPSDFEFEGYKGNAASWAEFGKFQLQLNAGRDQLPPAILQKVAQLTDGLVEPEQKIRRLYEYMQQNTRYISIQLGIGGLQPFEASFVAQKGYGDCKALSNYMYSLLKAAGIKSYYSWIRGGRSLDDRFVMADFPFDVFNHIVLCVPLAKDTVWLECTSQTDPAGYMGGFTGNRMALMITEDGGKLVNTPTYTAKENIQLRSLQGTVDEGGNLVMKVDTRYGATQQDYYDGLINALSKEKVKKYLNERLDLSSYEVTDFAYESKKGRLPEVVEHLTLDVSNYATVSGRRLFVMPNVMNRSGTRISETEKRTCDYVLDDPFTDVDSIAIIVPAGYTLEAVQPEVNLKTKFGSYTSKVKLEGDKIMYYRRMEQWPGRYPATDSAAIAEFYGTIYKADRSRVVLVKKEG